MSNVEQLEQETEQTRKQLSDTLDELRASMTPGRLIDQISERLSDGAPAEFTRNLKDQVVGNPLPVAAIGASLAWLMLGPRIGSGAKAGASVRGTANLGADGSAAGSGLADGVGSTMNRAKDAGRDAANKVGGGMRDAVGSLSQSAHQAAGGVRETASSMADAASRTVSSISESTKLAGHQTLKTGSTLLDFCREQPLFLAGLGIALGVLMGGLVPTTETEDRIMGDASDAMKEQAQDLASQYVEGSQTGERAADATQGEAAKPTGEKATGEQARGEKDPSSADGTLVSAEPVHPGHPGPDHPTLVPEGLHTPEDEWRDQPSNAARAPV
jgi:hypothetical protein